MTEQYLLVEVMNREVSVPEFFKTKEAAHDAMCDLVAKALGVTQEDIEKMLLANTESDKPFGISTGSAWGHRHGVDFDWKIFECSDSGEFLPV